VVTLEGFFTPIAPVRRGPVRVRVRYSAPGARSATERIENVTLERDDTSPLPKVEGLKAVRHGSRVDVTWRADRSADAEEFAVIGVPNRVIDPDGLVVAEAHATGPRRFSARLTGAKQVSYVFVFVSAEGSFAGPYVAEVR
jgi:hypothetical protein